MSDIFLIFSNIFAHLKRPQVELRLGAQVVAERRQEQPAKVLTQQSELDVLRAELGSVSTATSELTQDLEDETGKHRTGARKNAVFSRNLKKMLENIKKISKIFRKS